MITDYGRKITEQFDPAFVYDWDAENKKLRDEQA